MKRLLMICAAALLTAGLQTIGAQHAVMTAEKLLARAQHKVTVDRDLKGAIEDYKAAVTAAGPNRKLAADALIAMAECYEKLGLRDARDVYERVAQQYADQSHAADVANAKLGRRARSRNDFTMTRVRAGSVYRLSRDGRFYLDGRDGDVQLVELATGTTRRLTFQPEPDAQVWEHAFSPTGEQAAYAWYSAKDNRATLRLIATRGISKTAPRILVDNPEINTILPFDWSSDGRAIAVLVKRVDKTAQIGLVNPDNGRLTVLQTVDWAGVGGLRFSPDSKWLVFHRPERDGSFERDVYVVAVDGGRSAPISATQADESVVEWTTMGERLLIASDRGGSVGIWSVGLRNGVAVGRLDLVRPDVGYLRSIALDASETLFYTQLRASADIYLAPFDAAAGRLKSAPTQPIQRFSGFNWQPEWSADGKYIAYLSQRDVANVGRHTVVIHSIESGKAVREIRPELSYVAFPRWSRDGKQFIARGADLKGRSGIVKFDALTGAAALVVPNETCSNLPLWAPSGRSFYCYKQADKAILEVDAETGLVVKSLPNAGLPADVSADGRYLLHTGGGGLRVLTLATGESREVFRDQPDGISGAVTAIAWTPDNRSIAFSAIIRGEAGIWLIALDGGQPRKIVDVVADSMDEQGITRAVSSVRFNAANGYLVYSLGATPGRDVWKMENFLSPATSTSAKR